MKMKTAILTCCLSLMALLPLSPSWAEKPSKKEDPVTRDLKELARNIKDVLEQENQKEVNVGVFNDTGEEDSSGGPLIQTLLMNELRKLEIGINAKAHIRLTGEFYPDSDHDAELLATKIECRLRTKSGRSIKTLNKTLRTRLSHKNNREVLTISGINADLTEYTKATNEVRNKAAKQQQAKPPVYVEEGKNQVRKGSPFAVEILAAPAKSPASAFKPREGKIEKGQVFVSLQKGEEYRLKITNNARHEVVVSVTIDGVDAFQFFTPAENKPTMFLIRPGTQRVVQGWKFSNKESKAFLVGSLADSAAAKLLVPSRTIGTITICIHPCWEGKTPPQYEGSKDVGTEIGRPLPEDSKTVERTTGPLLEVINIRYKK